MNLKVAQGAMSFLALQGKLNHLQSVGITQEDFELVNGETPWSPSDRQKCFSIIGSLMQGSCDVMGVARFELPAEYVAASIAMFVHPNNSMVACRLFERTVSSKDLSRGDKTKPMDADKLFALVIELYSSSAATAAQALFEKNTKVAMNKLITE